MQINSAEKSIKWPSMEQSRWETWISYDKYWWRANSTADRTSKNMYHTIATQIDGRQIMNTRCIILLHERMQGRMRRRHHFITWIDGRQKMTSFGYVSRFRRNIALRHTISTEWGRMLVHVIPSLMEGKQFKTRHQFAKWVNGWQKI